MTKDQIVLHILSELIIEKCSTIFHSYLENPDDYIQDMYLEILNIDEDKLIKLYNEKTLFYYIITICRNQATNYKSTYNKRYHLRDVKFYSQEKLIALYDYYAQNNL